jgi:hypothetical protein
MQIATPESALGGTVFIRENDNTFLKAPTEFLRPPSIAPEHSIRRTFLYFCIPVAFDSLFQIYITAAVSLSSSSV